jgi:hypothetical protein
VATAAPGVVVLTRRFRLDLMGASEMGRQSNGQQEQERVVGCPRPNSTTISMQHQQSHEGLVILHPVNVHYLHP